GQAIIRGRRNIPERGAGFRDAAQPGTFPISPSATMNPEYRGSRASQADGPRDIHMDRHAVTHDVGDIRVIDANVVTDDNGLMTGGRGQQEQGERGANYRTVHGVSLTGRAAVDAVAAQRRRRGGYDSGCGRATGCYVHGDV